MNDVVFYNMDAMAFWRNYIGMPGSVEVATNIAANDAYFLRHINEYAKHYELTPDNACVALWCCEEDYARRRGDVHQKTFYKVWLEHTAFICDGVTGCEWIAAWCKDCLNELNRDPRSNEYSTHFSVQWSYEQAGRILKTLQDEGFISTNTTIDAFYYRMTGNGMPTSDKIEWIKKGKKNNSLISKRSLVYFVETIANYRVSKTKDCTDRINNIFGLSLSSSTINSTAVCEYKAEIDNIVETKNNLTGLFAR